MAKTLELQFTTDLGKSLTISVDAPKEPVDPVQVKQAMEEIIAANVFYGSNGKTVAAKGARIVERNVTDYEII
ncbi:DUF2922 domain-containing protein [Cytobacillus sp. Hz8]|uniref:DUF2922 domain-containing protein n=1 Tax=Cytobacillus sp. Hz8 TaxID=3347168 RepID=UPI0035E220CA